MNLLSINTSLPEHAFSTAELIEAFDGRLSTDLQKTIKNMGVENRHSVVSNFPEAITKGAGFNYTTSTTDFACKAANRCIEESNIASEDIGLLITVTNTQSYILPGLAYSLQAQMRDILSPAINIINMQGSGCSALLKAIELANWYLQINTNKSALVVSSEVHLPYSQVFLEKQYYSFHEIRESNRSQSEREKKTQSALEVIQSFLFGDGAVALLLGAGNGMNFNNICHLTNEKPEDVNLLMVKDGGTQNPVINGKVKYEMGPRVAPRGAEYARSLLKDILEQQGSPISDIKQSDFFLIHTGSKKILDRICSKINIPTSSPKVASPYKVLQRYGNLSSASIGFMLAEIQYEGVGVILSFGAGFSGSAGVVSFN
jgi:3-oxoacyl-[acyl-carrier-protein] synthase III